MGYNLFEKSKMSEMHCLILESVFSKFSHVARSLALVTYLLRTAHCVLTSRSWLV